MVLTGENTKSVISNRKTGSGGNKSFFTPCKRVGLSRKVGSITKKMTPAAADGNSSYSPSNIIVPASEDKLEKNEASKCNKSLGLTRKKGGECEFNVSVTSETSFNSSNLTISELNSTVSTSKMTQLSESDCEQTNADKKEVLTNHKQDIVQELIEKDDVSDVLINETEKCRKTEFVKDEDVVKDKIKCEKKKETCNMNDKNRKMKIGSKPTRKRFSSFFSSKTSSRASDSEDDFVCSNSSSQKSSDSDKSTIQSLLQCPLTVERSVGEDTKNRKRTQKKKKDPCSSDEEEFMPLFKKRRSKSTCSFSDTHVELKEKIHAKEQKIKEKEKTLAELKLVETYKKLHDVDKLENAIQVWRNGFKEALTDLQSELKVNNPDCTTSALLNKLHIPESVIKTCSFTD